MSILHLRKCYKMLFQNIVQSPGRGYLVYLSSGDVPFFRVSFSPIFARMGYQNKIIFLQPVVKICQKGICALARVCN